MEHEVLQDEEIDPASATTLLARAFEALKAIPASSPALNCRPRLRPHSVAAGSGYYRPFPPMLIDGASARLDTLQG